MRTVWIAAVVASLGAASPAIADLIETSIGTELARATAGAGSDEEMVNYQYPETATASASIADHTSATGMVVSGLVGDASVFHFTNELVCTYSSGSRSVNEMNLGFSVSADTTYELTGGSYRGPEGESGALIFFLGLYQIVNGFPSPLFEQDGGINMANTEAMLIGDDSNATVIGSPTGVLLAGEAYYMEMNIEARGNAAHAYTDMPLTIGTVPAPPAALPLLGLICLSARRRRA